MQLFQISDLLSVGLSILAIGLLGVIVYLSGRRSISNQTFLLFCCIVIFWSFFNYLSYKTPEPYLTLWFIRLTIFFGLWQIFVLYQLFYVYPLESFSFSKKYKYIIVPSVFFVSLLILSPLGVSSVSTISVGLVVTTKINVGYGMPFIGLIIFLLAITGISILIKKFQKAIGVEKKQFKLILLGTLYTYLLILIFNFLLPAFFKISNFVPFGALFTFPLITFTAYASIRYKLFNVKTIATQLLTFALWIFLLIRALLSQDLANGIINWSLFVITIVVGIFLIRSVMLEVKRREQLEKLTNLLGEATEKLEGANAQLKQLDQAKSDFISIASHQLRTPLTVIKGYISMMQEGSFGKIPPKINEHLTKVFLSNERLINLVEDLLNISRIESGRQQFDWTKFDIVELVGRLTEQLVQNAKAKGLKLSFHPPKKGKIEVTAEFNKLHDVIINFIDNAIKYTAEGEINVVIETAPKGMVTIKVKDTGRGLDEVTKNSLFQKFGRGQGSFQVNAGGTGLGLYVAKMIVEAHEGKIWAESDGVDKGSAFCFALPIDGPKNKSNMPFNETGKKVENPVASAPRPSLNIPSTPIKK